MGLQEVEDRAEEVENERSEKSLSRKPRKRLERKPHVPKINLETRDGPPFSNDVSCLNWWSAIFVQTASVKLARGHTLPLQH
jgi:hypothetical protein